MDYTVHAFFSPRITRITRIIEFNLGNTKGDPIRAKSISWPLYGLF
jgi:hypothetical protein